MAKRKRSETSMTNGVNGTHVVEKTAKPRPSARRSGRTSSSINVNYTVDQPSDSDPDVIDGEGALRASPSAVDHALSPAFTRDDGSDSSGFSSAPDEEALLQEEQDLIKPKTKKPTPKKSSKKPAVKKVTSMLLGDPEEGDEIKAEEEEVQDAIERPPAVNDDYRPLPWKGRLGFACLNTYLRNSNPPIFCSRTCRIETILKHDREEGAGAGMKYVQSLGYENASDLAKMIKWNEKYGIRFLRLSSEMFPFASHDKYGYTLEHAAVPLAEAGRLAMQYGHRLTMHPGQFTQLGSPRKEVVEASLRDLAFHCELLDRLQLKGQADRDAVMILHMGGVFGDKPATIARFREVYTTRLSDKIKQRLVLENDDMCYSVDDILPICQELGIPLVLDWHHNNIIFGNLREGTYDVRNQLGAAIKKTWTDKGITQKQHYSEPREGALTNMQRRRHSARVFDFPPCDDTMDLMIEAKDKEQAVFALMKKFQLPGYEKLGEVIPYERTDENKPPPKRKKKLKEGEVEPEIIAVPEEEVGMGGSENRVWWPEGMEEYLRPKKRERVKKEVAEGEEEEEDVKPAPKKKVSKKAKMVDNAEDVVRLTAEDLAEKVNGSAKVPKKRGKKAQETAEPEPEVEKPKSSKSKLKKAETNGVLKGTDATQNEGAEKPAAKKRKMTVSNGVTPAEESIAAKPTGKKAKSIVSKAAAKVQEVVEGVKDVKEEITSGRRSARARK